MKTDAALSSVKVRVVIGPSGTIALSVQGPPGRIDCKNSVLGIPAAGIELFLIARPIDADRVVGSERYA